jgi:hypothetical protein
VKKKSKTIFEQSYSGRGKEVFVVAFDKRMGGGGIWQKNATMRLWCKKLTILCPSLRE